MADVEQFYETVRQRAQGTPYAVTRTERGFDVHLDVADAQWYGPMSRAGLRKASTHLVRCDADAGTYSVLQRDDEVRWQAGGAGDPVPVLRASVERTYGRTRSLQKERVYAWDASGSYGRQVDFTYRSEEGRSLVTTVGGELGWQERRSGVEQAALYATFATLGLLVLGGLVALVVLLLR